MKWKGSRGTVNSFICSDFLPLSWLQGYRQKTICSPNKSWWPACRKKANVRVIHLLSFRYNNKGPVVCVCVCVCVCVAGWTVTSHIHSLLLIQCHKALKSCQSLHTGIECMFGSLHVYACVFLVCIGVCVCVVPIAPAVRLWWGPLCVDNKLINHKAIWPAAPHLYPHYDDQHWLAHKKAAAASGPMNGVVVGLLYCLSGQLSILAWKDTKWNPNVLPLRWDSCQWYLRRSRQDGPSVGFI